MPFFEKEPDWSNFSEYHFSDGRQVYEIHLSKLSGLVPKEFFEKYGTSGSDLVEETLMFVEHPDSEKGYTVLVARYFSYGQKSKGMTYHRIPKEWSGRIDIFTYAEQHLRSFEVEEGRLTSYHIYQTEDLSKRIQTHNALMTCTGYWVEFPYTYGIHMGIGSSHSIYVITCHNPDPFGGGTGTGSWPSAPVVSPDYLGGGYTGGGGNGTSPSGGGSTGTTYCDNTNHFGSDCIPFPEIEESFIENIIDPDQKRAAQLDYLRNRGGGEFVLIIQELLGTSGLTMGDIQEINKLVDQFYYLQKGLFLMAIFSPENIGTLLSFGLYTKDLSGLARNNYFGVIARYANNNLGLGYSSFTAFENTHGNAGINLHWHHVVEQHSGNITKFGTAAIHNTKNLFKVPAAQHYQITGYYNSIPSSGYTGNLTVRQWLSTKSFSQQYEFGLDIIHRILNNLPLP